MNVTKKRAVSGFAAKLHLVDLLAAMRELRRRIAVRGGRIDVKQLIEEGRRF